MSKQSNLVNNSQDINVDSSGNVSLDALSELRLQTGSVTMDCTPTAGATDSFVWNTSLSVPYVWKQAGTERMRIDASGRVTKPYQPVISGQMGTAMSSPSGTRMLEFNEFWTSQGITYNSTTKRFTVPIAGKYRVTLNPFFNTSATATRVQVGVNTDAPTSTTHYGHAYRETSTFDTGCINSVINLAANDYIVFYLAAGSLYNQSNDRFNQFSIELIG